MVNAARSSTVGSKPELPPPESHMTQQVSRDTRRLIAMLRHVKAFPTLAFAARRRHCSKNAFLTLMSDVESVAGVKLFEVGDVLSLTTAAENLLRGTDSLLKQRQSRRI